MKILIATLAAAALLPLAACAKHDNNALNGTEATANFEEFGNDSSVGADNVAVPEDNGTGLNATDLTNGAGDAN